MAGHDSVWGRPGWVIPPGGGEPVDVGGPHWPDILVRGTDVSGALGVFILHHNATTQNPPHAHHGFMKIIYILDGGYYFRVGDAEFSAGPGAIVVVPRSSYHTFVSATGGRLLCVCAPAGNEELLLELGRLGPDAPPAQAAELYWRFATTALPGDEGRPWFLPGG